MADKDILKMKDECHVLKRLSKGNIFAQQFSQKCILRLAYLGVDEDFIFKKLHN